MSESITEACNSNVSGLIGHVSCAVHRACNDNSFYNPENCMVHWNHIKDNGGLAPASRKIIKTLLKQMRGSSTFNEMVAWKNEEFKNTYRPLFKFKSSQPNEVVSFPNQCQMRLFLLIGLTLPLGPLICFSLTLPSPLCCNSKLQRRLPLICPLFLNLLTLLLRHTR